MRGFGIIVAGLSVGLSIGCERRQPGPPAAPPTTRVAVTPKPPATQAVESPRTYFLINGQTFPFPAAKVVTKATADGLRVTLFSDDPPEALRDGYQGNSFYFRFLLDADTADLAGQQFVFRDSFTEQEDTTNGLFIAGGRQSLRPVDVGIAFDRSDGQLICHVGGNFRLTDEQNAADAGVTVRAQADPDPAWIDPGKSATR